MCCVSDLSGIPRADKAAVTLELKKRAKTNK